MSVLYLQSGHGDLPGHGQLPAAIQAAVAAGRVTVVPQPQLDAATLLAHRGLITGNLLDQDALLALAPALAAFLDRGGRWVFNGHLLRPLVAGLAPYQTIANPRRPDFDLRVVQPHPVFAGIDVPELETNKGVAGFYGRGCNPPPVGAVVLNTLGTPGVAVDWVWHRPAGGAILSHAGNDLGQLASMHDMGERMWANLLEWAAGGADVGSEAPRVTTTPVPAPWPTRPAARPAGGPRLVATNAGTYYQIETLEGARYRDHFDAVITPEEIGTALRPDDALFVTCRTPPQRLIAQSAAIAAHLAAGGTVIAMGESRNDLWLPGIDFTPVPTNWWWWRTPGADLGVRRSDDDHPLLAGLDHRDVTWHLHGHYRPPAGATVLVRDGAGQAVLYEDRVTTPGRLIVTSLDPAYHHGSRFMPATTRFLDRFLPNLRQLLAVPEPA